MRVRVAGEGGAESEGVGECEGIATGAGEGCACCGYGTREGCENRCRCGWAYVAYVAQRRGEG